MVFSADAIEDTITMRMLNIFLGIVLVFATIAVFWSFLRMEDTSPQATNKAAAATEPTPREQNPFLKLRLMALDTPADEFETGSDATKPHVYGIVMDWNVGEGIATFVGFESGDASMYTSSGGGVIGGMGHENVKRAAISFVSKAQLLLPKDKKSDDTSPAGANRVKFFFLTDQGRFVAEEQMENFDNETSEWLDLFIEANKMITELRSIADQQ